MRSVKNTLIRIALFRYLSNLIIPPENKFLKRKVQLDYILYPFKCVPRSYLVR